MKGMQLHLAIIYCEAFLLFTPFILTSGTMKKKNLMLLYIAVATLTSLILNTKELGFCIQQKGFDTLQDSSQKYH